MAGNEKFTMTLTSSQGRVALLVGAVLIGGSGVANILVDKRPDPFTGTQGRALERRILELEQWRNTHVIWGRERSIIQSEQDARQDAQIEELMRHHNRHHNND